MLAQAILSILCGILTRKGKLKQSGTIRSPKILFCSILVLSYHFLAQTTFKNPIITGMNPDSSICRAGDDYYMVTSTFEYFLGLPIYQSKDLVHWKLIGYALSRASNNPLAGCESSTGGQYAPTIRYHNGNFHVTGTNY
jgi:xylan 1,4-beta-xylosidase